MGIQLVEEKRHHLGESDITRPIFICDYCGEEIEQHDHGYYLFHSRNETHPDEEFYGVPFGFYLVHAQKEIRRGCWDGLVKEKFGDEFLVLDMPLGSLLGYMSNVLGYTEKDREKLYQ